MNMPPPFAKNGIQDKEPIIIKKYFGYVIDFSNCNLKELLGINRSQFVYLLSIFKATFNADDSSWYFKTRQQTDRAITTIMELQFDENIYNGFYINSLRKKDKIFYALSFTGNEYDFANNLLTRHDLRAISKRFINQKDLQNTFPFIDFNCDNLHQHIIFNNPKHKQTLIDICNSWLIVDKLS